PDAQDRYPVGSGHARPLSAQVTDDNGDGRIDDRDIPDLVTADPGSGTVTVLRGNRDGTFGPITSAAVAGGPAAAAAGGFHRDGTPDLAVVGGAAGNNGAVLLGLGGGAFLPPGTGSAARATPLLADVNGDGTPDAVVVGRDGRILVRLGRAGA